MLAENNIFARKYFYPLTNAFDAYHGKFDPNSTPVALHIRKLPTDKSNAYADDPVKKTKEDYTRAQWQIDAHEITEQKIWLET